MKNCLASSDMAHDIRTDNVLIITVYNITYMKKLQTIVRNGNTQSNISKQIHQGLLRQVK